LRWASQSFGSFGTTLRPVAPPPWEEQIERFTNNSTANDLLDYEYRQP
jgi:hypothetical protein